MATYGNNKKFKIIGYDLKLSPTSKFPDKKFKNYLEYFVQKYKVPSKQIDQNQFLVISEIPIAPIKVDGKIVKRQQIHLIPQLLRPTGLTEQQKTNYKVMKDIGQYTIIRPHQRKNIVENMIEKTFNKNEANEQFQITFQLDSNKVQGYLVQRPQLKQKNGKNFNLKNDKIPLQDLIKTCNFEDWVILYDFPNEKYVKALENGIFRCSKKLGLKIQAPEKILLPKAKYYKTSKDADNFVKDFHQEEISRKPNVILYLVSKQVSKLLYNAVKKYYIKQSVPTQFIDSFRDKDTQNLSKISNVVVQINNKMGGRGWELINKCPNTLILGVETSIIQTGKDFREMIALCGQYGDNLKKQLSFSSAKLTKDFGKNSLKNLPNLVIQAINEYKSKEKTLPEKIILYRMGLGEGQVRDAIDHEIISLKNSIAENYQKDAPKLIFIMVNKKINDRFYVQSQKGIDNPEGLVVMDDVVQKDRANFYMIPQKVNQGTATPCHYIVLDNDGCDFSLEKIIQVTMNLCYDYQNWNGPIRVPSVLQNASKLCALFSQIKTDKISKQFISKLFYL